MQRGKRPYSQFGQRLSEIRKSLSESVHEVSGAIEVDTEILEKFENGEDRPSEDLLMLLVSHFDIKDEVADELFELAGYSFNDPAGIDAYSMQPIVVVPIDSRIVYTDSANIVINDNGLVMGFMQNGMNNQPATVSRVGMSLNHARKLVKTLQETIDKADGKIAPKLLSPSKETKKKSKKSN